MAPIIRAVLTNLISAEEASSINIIANDVEYTDEAQEGKTWKIVYRHPERSVPLRCGIKRLFGLCAHEVVSGFDGSTVDMVMTSPRPSCLIGTCLPSLPCSSVETVYQVGLARSVFGKENWAFDLDGPCSVTYRHVGGSSCRFALCQANG